MNNIVPVLTIAGSDSSGGAGIQADLKTMMAHGVYGMSVITAITAQNTTGVKSFEAISPSLVSDQIEMVLNDIPPLSIKTGMLANANIIKAIADSLSRYPTRNLVIDPVMVSTSGSQLIDDSAIDTLISTLFPLSTLITPNVNETIRLTGSKNVSDQIRALHSMGAENVLLKGGDSDDVTTKTDVLSLNNGEKIIKLSSPAINTKNTHGTGCTLSAAIASSLALGLNLEEAVRQGKNYINEAISRGANYIVGSGHGPVNHYITNNDKPTFL